MGTTRMGLTMGIVRRTTARRDRNIGYSDMSMTQVLAFRGPAILNRWHAAEKPACPQRPDSDRFIPLCLSFKRS